MLLVSRPESVRLWTEKWGYYVTNIYGNRSSVQFYVTENDSLGYFSKIDKGGMNKAALTLLIVLNMIKFK